MKKLITGIILGTFIGLFIGGLYWYQEYSNLNEKYLQTVEVVNLLAR